MDVATSFTLEIVTPEGKVVDERVEYVSAPGTEGDFGVLEGHAEFLTTLKPGEIIYKDDKGEHYVAVGWGYAEVGTNSVIILADNAERATQINLERAIEDKKRWEDELSKITHADERYSLCELKLQRANARINVAGRIGKK